VRGPVREVLSAEMTQPGSPMAALIDPASVIIRSMPWSLTCTAVDWVDRYVTVTVMAGMSAAPDDVAMCVATATARLFRSMHERLAAAMIDGGEPEVRWSREEMATLDRYRHRASSLPMRSLVRR
jgi:hypothetical protein